MPGTRHGRPPSTSSASSLMQDVPGAFPLRTSIEQEDSEDETTYMTLAQAVHARRAQYVTPKHVRIKVGTWNVAAHKGSEKDVGAWFVEGKGVSPTLAGLEIQERRKSPGQDHQFDSSAVEGTETVAAQEARFKRKQPTVPHGDPGALPGDDDIGLYVLGLQEVVDISSATEAFRPYTDPSVATRWKDEMQHALPKGYELVAEQQLIGLLILIYASPEVVPDVKSVSTTSVGTGLMGYMGNKGAVTARIVLGDTTRLVFVNSHLAAGADKTALERRNWDAAQIVQRTKFEQISDSMDTTQTMGEQIGDEDFGFWVGDLNYRLEGIPGDDVRRLLMLHTRNAYDLSHRSAQKIDSEINQATEAAKQSTGRSSIESASGGAELPQSSTDRAGGDDGDVAPSTTADDIAESDDPASLQTTLSSLLPHDELHQQMKSRKAFHDGWREGPITFLPTYKYDPGSVGVFDSSEKKRAPSWCDRILYRTRRDKLAYESKIVEEANAKKKDEEMRANGLDQAGDDEQILYDYDPDTDGANNEDYCEYDEYDDAEDGVVITKEGFEDEMHLEYYTAHQRVLSSDHKPLNAIFRLRYDAVIPEQKAKVHAEVARDLDKAENEGRPNVTVVVDQNSDTGAEQSEDSDLGFEGVWFGHVRWGQSKHRSITVANTSRVPANCNFIERPVALGQPSGLAPPWLKLKLNGTYISSSVDTPSPFSIEPGETAVIELELRISEMGLVQTLNQRVQGLDDILVLRVEGGRDHFIPVRAKWLDTSLGHSINKLIRIPEGGIRRLQHQKPDKSKRASLDLSLTKSLSREHSSSAASQRSKEASSEEAHPVRFSAPRELFRLTEAIEGVAARIIAEWTMTSSSPSEHAEIAAPWLQRPGWPFDEECWTERATAHFESAVSDACDALDTDGDIEASLDPDLPRLQRLYVLCSLLLLFLKQMPDGIIDGKLWAKLDTYLVDYEKAKHKPSNEDLRTNVQEILSISPAHSISFIIITAMLGRMLTEIGATSNTKDDRPQTPTSKLRGGTIRRMTGLGKAATASQEERTVAVWANIFAGVVIRSSESGGKKVSAVQERRKVELLEVFLRKDDP